MHLPMTVLYDHFHQLLLLMRLRKQSTEIQTACSTGVIIQNKLKHVCLILESPPDKGVVEVMNIHSTCAIQKSVR